jgi:hypothetical protein
VEAGDSPAGTEEGETMRQDTTQDVLIEQDTARMKVVATFTPDTETGDPEGWAILYRVPEDGALHAIDEDRPFSVVSATGKRAHFVGWRKVGRRRLGIGIGSPPVEPV